MVWVAKYGRVIVVTFWLWQILLAFTPFLLTSRGHCGTLQKVLDSLNKKNIQWQEQDVLEDDKLKSF